VDDEDDVVVIEKMMPDDIDRYAGRWVAIRGLEVVADAETLAELRADPRVDQRDLVYAVPPPGVHFY
jgi:hypothetical protein